MISETKDSILVIGHQNPDLDSVCSAWAYAALKNRLALETPYVSGRCGRLNRQSRAVFKRWGIEPPPLVQDVYPSVGDVIRTDVGPVEEEDSILSVIEYLNRENLSLLPVVSGKNFRGTVSIRDISRFFMHQNGSRPEYPFIIDNLNENIPGEFIRRGEQREFRACIVTGAMDYDISVERIRELQPKKPVLVVGPRPDLIEYAVEEDFPLLVITGLRRKEEFNCDLSRYKGTVYLSFTDTAETIRLLRLSVPVKNIVNTEIPPVEVDTRFNDALNLLINSDYRGLPVFRKEVFQGIVTRRCFIRKPVRRIILIDHNEIDQSVKGAEEAEIVEIIDHHRLGAEKTRKPIYIAVKPLGSSCTLVYQHYRMYGIPVEETTARVLISGILSDTVILKSPTTTEEDRLAVRALAEVAGIDYSEYGQWIFSQTPALTNNSPESIVDSDFKIYEDFGRRVGIGQVEVMTFNDVPEMKQALLETMEERLLSLRLDWAMLLVTNVLKQDSLLLSTRFKEGETQLLYSRQEEGLYTLPHILSRKKQLLPEVLRVLETVSR